jgi:hypothetical protein
MMDSITGTISMSRSKGGVFHHPVKITFSAFTGSKRKNLDMIFVPPRTVVMYDYERHMDQPSMNIKCFTHEWEVENLIQLISSCPPFPPYYAMYQRGDGKYNWGFNIGVAVGAAPTSFPPSACSTWRSGESSGWRPRWTASNFSTFLRVHAGTFHAADLKENPLPHSLDPVVVPDVETPLDIGGIGGSPPSRPRPRPWQRVVDHDVLRIHGGLP